MIKQFVFLLAVSFLVLIGEPYVKSAMEFLWHAHTYTADTLSHIFSGDHDGRLARDWIALIFVPIGIAAIPSLLFWAVRRSFFGYAMEIVWVIWLLQVGMMVANSGIK